MNKIREAIKTNNGKLIYVIEMQQGKDEKIQLYINSHNEIHFDSNMYSFNSYSVFDINKDAHRVAKEIFLTYLQAYVKTRLLELKQLELVLDELGLNQVIRKTIIDNSSMLLDTRNEIIQESIECTQKLINENTKSTKEMVKKNLDSAKQIIKTNLENVGEIIEFQTNKIIEDTVRPIARKGKKST